jgi:6-phosphofructokinase 1
VELIAAGKFGRMVTKDGETIDSLPLEQVGGKLKLVPPDHSIVKKSRKMGICFGDRKI